MKTLINSGVAVGIFLGVLSTGVFCHAFYEETCPASFGQLVTDLRDSVSHHRHTPIELHLVHSNSFFDQRWQSASGIKELLGFALSRRWAVVYDLFNLTQKLKPSDPVFPVTHFLYRNSADFVGNMYFVHGVRKSGDDSISTCHNTHTIVLAGGHCTDCLYDKVAAVIAHRNTHHVRRLVLVNNAIFDDSGQEINQLHLQYLVGKLLHQAHPKARGHVLVNNDKIDPRPFVRRRWFWPQPKRWRPIPFSDQEKLKSVFLHGRGKINLLLGDHGRVTISRSRAPLVTFIKNIKPISHHEHSPIEIVILDTTTYPWTNRRPQPSRPLIQNTKNLLIKGLLFKLLGWF